MASDPGEGAVLKSALNYDVIPVASIRELVHPARSDTAFELIRKDQKKTEHDRLFCSKREWASGLCYAS